MMAFWSLGVCVWVSLMVTVALTQWQSPIIPDGCRLSKDVSHGGLRLDCSNAGITSHDIRNLSVKDATTLILDDNPLGSLLQQSLQNVPNLVVLSLIRCNLDKIEPHAFQDLPHLKELHLNENHLRFHEASLPFHVFDPLQSLETLVLNFNDYHQDNTSYSESLGIFRSLKNLSSLFLDSFPVLYIGNEFAELEKLETLFISCLHVHEVHNNSLEGLKFSTVKRLTLFRGIQVYYSNFHTGVFEPLPDLELLFLQQFYVGNRLMLRAMEGLQQKNIHTIKMSEIRQNKGSEGSVFGGFLDSYISAEETAYLSKICVNHLIWTFNGILSMEFDGLITDVFKRCLISLDLSGNNLIDPGSVDWFQIGRLAALEEISYSQNSHPQQTPRFWEDSVESFPFHNYYKPAYHDLFGKILSHQSAREERGIAGLFFSSPSILKMALFNKVNTSIAFIPLTSKLTAGKSVKNVQALEMQANVSTASNINSIFPKKKVIYFSNSLKVIRMDDFKKLFFSPDAIIEGGKSLREIYMRFLHDGVQMVNFKGLNNLRLIDFTASIVEIPDNFFQVFPNLSTVVLKRTQNNPDFLQTHTERLLRYNGQLEYLDISQNGLNCLPDGTFRNNNKLCYLCLASNRFTKIPFPLSFTPSLEILDLRNNSFTSFSYEERKALDAHQHKVSNFTILLAGNALACTCTTRDFTTWLHSTAVRFDHGGNYSCVREDGQISYTVLPTSADVVLRRCEGRFYLMLSFTVLGVMSAVYTGAYFSSRYHKLVISKILLLLAPGHRILSRSDFAYDVFIAYGDSDVELVRFRLLPLIEERWNLRAFVHHRDLRQDILQLGGALRDSWRCLLILSDDFLTSEMAPYIMKSAAFFVSAANLKKLVVVVEERNQYNIPDYVLQVTDEDNILVVTYLSTPLAPDVLGTLQNRLMT